MVASIAAVHDTSESQRQLQTLQEENFLLKQQLSKSMTSMISTGKVSVTSAEKGDIVLVIWSEEHSNYQIYHEVKSININRNYSSCKYYLQGSSLHFLHTESVAALGLSPTGSAARKRHVTAEVEDREYCQAKKAENR